MGECYLKELEYNNCVYIDKNRDIIFDFEDVIDRKAYEREAISDLITAGYVEKVEDKQ